MVEPDMSGARAVMQLARSADDAVGQLQAARRAQESAAVARAVAETKAEWTAKFLEASQNAPEGAQDFGKTFLSDFDATTAAKVRDLSPEARQAFATRAIELKSALQVDADRFEIEARNKKAASDATEAANVSINAVRGNPALLDGVNRDLDEMVGALPTTAANKAALKRQFRAQAATAAVQGVSDRDPQQALRLLKSGAFDSDLAPNQKAALINGVEVDIRQRNAEARAAAAEARALKREQEIEVERQRLIDVAKFEMRVRKGQASGEEIEAKWGDGKGALRPNEYVELASLQLRADAERAKAEAGIRKVGAALDAGIGLDYRNGDDRKAVDTYFQQNFAPSIANEDADTQASAVVNFSDRVGMVPESVQSAMRINLRNGTPEQIVKVADVVGRLSERNPQLLNDFEKDEIALGTMVDRQIKAGVEPQRAVQQAKEAISVPQATRDERKMRFRVEKLGDKIPSLLAREFSHTFARNPEIGDPAVGQFRQSYEDYFAATGNAETAQKAALADFRRVWGESRVNGKRELMQYPPESFYAVGGDGEYIRKQMIEDVSPLVEKDRAEKVMLVPDIRTAREASAGRPSYALMMQDEQGRLLPVLKDGVPQRFVPDPVKQIEEEKARQVQRGEDLRDYLRRSTEPPPGIPTMMREAENERQAIEQRKQGSVW